MSLWESSPFMWSTTMQGHRRKEGGTMTSPDVQLATISANVEWLQELVRQKSNIRACVNNMKTYGLGLYVVWIHAPMHSLPRTKALYLPVADMSTSSSALKK
ncbi:hypothetical protein RF11_05143 [Thelohanellus kitauei]|uniref:Uncharacterized protein n=1 Tax=Thelohanellus kitauei TaxID=669202 RepID=A0A0C2MIL8_THEKT|nr:hypothetical protein RF11_05143 [Thelohanellus kitauei]